MTTVEERWAAAERTLEGGQRKRMRRTPGLVVGITGLLVLAVGLTAAVDLRRLQTPRGASLAWTDAAVFGNCRAYLSLSQPVEPEARSDDAVCRSLRAKTREARDHPERFDVRGEVVSRTGRTATAVVRLRRPDGATLVRLRLVRRGDHWLVLLDPTLCVQLGCA